MRWFRTANMTGMQALAFRTVGRQRLMRPVRWTCDTSLTQRQQTPRPSRSQVNIQGLQNISVPGSPLNTTLAQHVPSARSPFAHPVSSICIPFHTHSYKPVCLKPRTYNANLLCPRLPTSIPFSFSPLHLTTPQPLPHPQYTNFTSG